MKITGADNNNKQRVLILDPEIFTEYLLNADEYNILE